MFKLPISASRGTKFDYFGEQLEVSPVTHNPYIGDKGAFVLELSWEVDGVQKSVAGIAVSSGVDILVQYTTPLPNLYAINTSDPTKDITSVDELNLYIIN